MMIKGLNPEAEEFLPHAASPYESSHREPERPVSIPLSPYPYYTCYQKMLQPPPRLLPGPSPCYIVDKFGGVHYLPSLHPRLVTFYDAYRQPQPHGLIKPLVPINHRADKGAPAGNGAKNLTAKASGENFGGKIRMAWVPKKRKSKGKVGSMPLPPCPTLDEDGVRTTLMIRNIPNRFRRHMLIEFIDKLCLEQNQKSNSESNPPRFEYDFLYLPMDFRRNNNLGYAFVNFTSAVAAARVREILRGYKWGVFKDTNDRTIYSRKVLEITWAKSQGKEEMVTRFRNSQFRCQYMEYLPVVFTPVRDGANAAASLTVVGSCLPPQ